MNPILLPTPKLHLSCRAGSFLISYWTRKARSILASHDVLGVWLGASLSTLGLSVIYKMTVLLLT